MDNTILTVEYSSPDYDARTKNTARLLSVAVTLDGSIRVTISAEAAIGNCTFVTLSDETMSPELYRQYVEPGIKSLPGVVVRFGTLPL